MSGTKKPAIVTSYPGAGCHKPDMTTRQKYTILFNSRLNTAIIFNNLLQQPPQLPHGSIGFKQLNWAIFSLMHWWPHPRIGFI